MVIVPDARSVKSKYQGENIKVKILWVYVPGVECCKLAGSAPLQEAGHSKFLLAAGQIMSLRHRPQI